MRRFKWSFDAATTIAIAALLLSTVQFVLTTPLFADFYFHPKLKITGNGSQLDSKTLVGNFILRNDGRAAARNVEIGLVLQENQRVSIMPSIKSQIVETDDNPSHIRNVRIEVPQLNSGEQIFIVVMPGENSESLNEELVGFLKASGIREIPFVSFIKSGDGGGENLTKGTGGKISDISRPASLPSPK